MAQVGAKNCEEVIERQMLVSTTEVDVSEASEVSVDSKHSELTYRYLGLREMMFTPLGQGSRRAGVRIFLSAGARIFLSAGYSFLQGYGQSISAW